MPKTPSVIRIISYAILDLSLLTNKFIAPYTIAIIPTINVIIFLLVLNNKILTFFRSSAVSVSVI